MYSLGQAARAAGKAKSTISRDVKTGRISATRNPDGSLVIDPAELHRVYPAVLHSNGGDVRAKQSGTGGRTVAMLEQVLFERGRLLADREETIRDQERRRMQAQLTALLSAPPKSDPPAPRRWSRRVLAWIVWQHV